MSKLLRARFRRCFKSLIFWLSLVASVILGFLSGVRVKEDYTLDDIYIIAGFLIYAILLSLMIGREFGDGGFRNKIISGHMKGRIFFSEYIVSIVICLMLCMVSASIFALFNFSLFGRIPTELLLKSIAGFALLIVSMVTIIASVCLLIQYRAVMAIVAILLVLVSYMVSYTIKSELNNPEFVKKVEFVDGKPTITEETLEKNPSYVDSPLREQYIFVMHVLPHGQILEYMDIVEPLFDPITIYLSVAEEDAKILNVLPFYSVGTILTFSLFGFLIFRKKAIK